MSKFSVDDHVRVTDIEHEKCDQVGRVDHVFRELNGWLYSVNFYGVYMPIREHHLILADPDVHTVLDQMDAESAAPSRGGWIKPPTPSLNVDQEIAAEYIAARNAHDKRVTAEDKLRMIADTVEQQLPVGSELASFRRRLSAILSIGHDA